MRSVSLPSLMRHLFAPYRVLQTHRNLQLLFAGQLVSALGGFLYVVALAVLVYQFSGSATLVAALMFVRLLPYALLLPLAGMLADRSNRKGLMIAADVGRCICMLGMLLVRSPDTLWIAFPLVFVTTALASLFRPALGAVLPTLVEGDEQLTQAKALMSQVIGVSLVLGPALGGLLVGVGETHLAFVLNATTFFVSAATLLLIRVGDTTPEARPTTENWFDATRAGYRFLFRENEGVLAAFTVASICGAAFSGAFWTLSVVLSDQTFGLGTQGSGYLNAAYGLGGLLSGWVVGSLRVRMRLSQFFLLSNLVSAVAAGVIGISPSGILPFVLLLFLGATDVFVEMAGTLIVQTGTPNELLGRVVAAWESTFVLVMLLGSLAVGPLIDVFGPRQATVLFAVSNLVLLLLSFPRLRRLDEVMGVRMFARQVPVLTVLPHRVLDEFASRVRLESFAAGETIVHEGEHGDRLYLIKDGLVQIAAHGNQAVNMPIATLGKLDYFGEIALLRDVPRTATVIAQAPTELFSLSRTDFEQLIERSGELHAAMRDTGDSRAVDTQTQLFLSGLLHAPRTVTEAQPWLISRL